MRTKTRRREPTASQSSFYRCPECGTEVDNRQIEQVRRHHDHVLHPQWYRRCTSAFTGAAKQGDGLGADGNSTR
jgi:hypothetical protein